MAEQQVNPSKAAAIVSPPAKDARTGTDALPSVVTAADMLARYEARRQR